MNFLNTYLLSNNFFLEINAFCFEYSYSLPLLELHRTYHRPATTRLRPDRKCHSKIRQYPHDRIHQQGSHEYYATWIILNTNFIARSSPDSRSINFPTKSPSCSHPPLLAKDTRRAMRAERATITERIREASAPTRVVKRLG